MSHADQLRAHLLDLLGGGHAHLHFDQAVAGLPPNSGARSPPACRTHPGGCWSTETASSASRTAFMGEVVGIHQETARLQVRLDQDGRAVSLRVDEYGAKNIRLGYASTVHKSQGRTVEHCHVLMGGHMTDRHLGYVQASRCRESTHLFIDRAHAGPDLREAIRALSRDRSKDLASDILDQAQKRTREQQETLQQQRRQRL